MPLDTTHLTSILSLLITLSIATERLVEIVKGAVPWLNATLEPGWKEDVRKCIVQAMAVVAGMGVAYVGVDSIPNDLFNGHSFGGIALLGLLASGGSGFWNAILTYVLQVKNLKVAEATTTQPVIANPVKLPPSVG